MATKNRTIEALKDVDILLAFGERIMIDLQDPTLKERLRRRTPEGRYEISEIDLVLNIRDLRTRETCRERGCSAKCYLNEVCRSFNATPGACDTGQNCAKRPSPIWLNTSCARHRTRMKRLSHRTSFTTCAACALTNLIAYCARKGCVTSAMKRADQQAARITCHAP